MRKIYVVLCLLMPFSAVFGYNFEGYITGENIGDQYGSSACFIDFNADGFPDLAVSAPASDAGGASSGKVYIYYGGPSADLVADVTMTGAASSFFGQVVASAGDFNADGYEDLLVGAPFYDLPVANAGAVYLYYGGPSADNVADHIFTGQKLGDYFGAAVAGVGDINGDGIGDIAIGAYKADRDVYVDAGLVYCYFGGLSVDYYADRILAGAGDDERFGFSVTGGDFNADGRSDIAVGAYSYDSPALNAGRVYVFNGGGSLDTLASLIITGDSAGYKFGWKLAAGSVTGDDLADLVMGTDGVEVDTFAAGRVYVFDGGPSMDSLPAYSYTPGGAASDQLGDAVVSGVDFDGDGHDEMAAGMPGNSDHGDLAGGAIVFSGGAVVTVDSVFYGYSASEEMGRACAFWPGYKGSTGVAFGAPGYDSYRGRLYLYKAAPPATNLPPVLSPIGPKTGYAGESLTFSVRASDPNWTVPSITAGGLPTEALLIDLEIGTALFEWTAGPEEVGPHQVTFMASDGQYADSEVVTITIADPTACCHGYTGNTDCDMDEKCNLADITRLIDRVYISRQPLCCEAAGNVTGDVEGKINLADITELIDHVYVSRLPTAPCQ